MIAEEVQPASFRDPSGFVFLREGQLYRRVNASYRDDYDHLIRSGLYQTLVEDGLLIPHVEVCREGDASASILLRPERVPFLSYPYEWCFSQLRDAALATLRIGKKALRFGMFLKDASAYNIQFVRGKPCLIDTLSFERYHDGEPWVAYRQFCQHFLAPLALMRYRDVRLAQLLRPHTDGIPLDLASRLLPGRTRWNPALFAHIHLHAAAQRRHAGGTNPTPRGGMDLQAFLGLLDSLEGCVRGMTWESKNTPWARYYADTNYTATAMAAKERVVAAFLDDIAPAPRSVWDLGANTGRFSRLASERGIPTVAWDGDPAAVETCYLDCRARADGNLLPLLQDLTNPSPDLGWAQRERQSFLGRGPADAVLALALVHHLAIGNNVPLEQIASFFARCGAWLIVEFASKRDSQVRRLLARRRDIFDDYTEQGFAAAFGAQWSIVRSVALPETERTMYLMRRRESV